MVCMVRRGAEDPGIPQLLRPMKKKESSSGGRWSQVCPSRRARAFKASAGVGGASAGVGGASGSQRRNGPGQQPFPAFEVRAEP